MKKFLVAFLLLSFPIICRASIQDPLVEQEKTYVVHFTTTVAANTTAYFDLISLSTTASLFPHTAVNPGDTGELDVTHVTYLVDKIATATTTFKVGVLNFVCPSSASATYFFTRSSLNNVSNTDVIVTANFTPSMYRCRVKPAGTATNSNVDGSTPFLLSNDKDTGTILVNSTTTLASPISSGSVLPRVGDIIMKVVTFQSAINYIVDVWYHAEP